MKLVLLLAGVCALAALASTASADVTVQAESGSPSRRSVKVIRDTRARGGRAVLLQGAGTLRLRVATPAFTRVAVRARGIPCRGRPRLVLRLDGRRAGSARVPSRRWRTYSFGASARAGSHLLSLTLANPRRVRGCRRRLVVDAVRLVAAEVPPAPKPTPTPSPPPQATQAVTPPPTFTNPVWPSGMADPMVLDLGARHDDYWAYATGGSFPTIHSRDLVHWEDKGGAMPSRPDWTPQTGEYNPWGPSVLEVQAACPGAAQGPCFVMYHVGLNATLTPPSNCIGAATSPTPGGPFVERGILDDAAKTRDQSDRPIGCGDDAGYSNIDPAPLVTADGRAYLYFSTGHRCAAPSAHASCPFDRDISMVPLADDRLTAAGPRTELFENDQPWEHAIVEGPWPVEHGNSTYLLYSGGAYTGSYGMGYASAPAAGGPFVKSAANPSLKDGNGVFSAGGGSLVTGPGGGTWAAYHGRPGGYDGPRLLRLDPVTFAGDGSLAIDGPSTAARPVP